MSEVLDTTVVESKTDVKTQTPVRKCISGCRDTVSLVERVCLIALITLGIESALFFLFWWFEPQHRRNNLFFVFLSFAIGWGVFRTVINWFYLFFITGTNHKKVKEGLSVDVFTTAMPGEPYEMFEKTLSAIAKIQYPHTSYLLDGGNDPKLQKLCQKLGVIHLDCSKVEGAKAGKVNYAMQRSSGEYILVIDPDHIPEDNFFHQVLGHFDDPQVGFVQVVQGYYNQSESFVARASAEQTYDFYGPTMMGMQGLGTTVAIGANCTFRRSALESIGGHAVHLAEDLVTSIRLHASGWKSAYVPYKLTSGLAPGDLGAYFKQQLKWCTGMFGAFSQEVLPRFKKLKFSQKLHYLFAGSYYLEGLATAITCILPIIFLFFGLWAVEMEFTEFLIHLAPYALMCLVISWYVQRWFRHPDEKGFLWRSMVLKKGTWPIYIIGLINWITRQKVPYLPTPKKKECKTFTGLVIPHLFIVVLSVAAVVYSILTYDRMESGVWVMIFFAVCNVILMLPVVVIAHSQWFTSKGGSNE
ncbi:glycosyltransferase family 2 protein [Chitinispirillales bacterium ANBcel5]|uniref:glycosyltransferase family 2 protein n=1 Tax=Cellulosispirillum alkaliphilum TaxID=3039283 RepID=UPI002A594193|nr:glycosyltransferase family 2 protein [Chitinispirillales bacterium ANBcel5]